MKTKYAAYAHWIHNCDVFFICSQYYLDQPQKNKNETIPEQSVQLYPDINIHIFERERDKKKKN